LTFEELFSGVFAHGEAAAAVSDEAWLQAMLDFEVGLARACARVDLIPAEHAEAIARAADPARFDIVAIGRASAATGNPVVALLDVLRSDLGDEAASVHFGATSQDVVDSAGMLVTKRALVSVLADADAAASATARLADDHRSTLMIGRTLLQQALPTTFGLKAAIWLNGLDLAGRRVAEAAEECLAVQLGGAVGTLVDYGDRGPALLTELGRELELNVPVVPWHTERVRVVALADAAAALAGAVGKIARDVTLLSQDEISEVREGGKERGASSTMAHKRNPVASVAIIACARRIPGLVSALHASMSPELERGVGTWQAEWGSLSDLLRLTGSSASWARDLLEHLQVDGERMQENLEGAASRAPAAADTAGVMASAPILIDRALAIARAGR
jgi:3-carboxy-cis,cis-muconate cycloisomerase